MPMRRVLALLALLLLVPAAVRAQDAPACGTPLDLLEAPALPSFATGLLTRRLRVLAVGSASVLSPGVSSETASWSARLREILTNRYADLDLRIEVQGGRGLTAADQWRTIEEGMRRERRDLVIWQAGATEAVRSLPVEDLTEVLTRGLAALHARGVDVVVMDQQFSRFLRTNADVEPYRDALRIASAAGQAALFRRYDMMRAWMDAGTIDIERAPRAQRTVEVDRMNDCLAQAMALFLRNGSRLARR